MNQNSMGSGLGQMAQSSNSLGGQLGWAQMNQNSMGSATGMGHMYQNSMGGQTGYAQMNPYSMGGQNGMGQMYQNSMGGQIGMGQNYKAGEMQQYGSQNSPIMMASASASNPKIPNRPDSIPTDYKKK